MNGIFFEDLAVGYAVTSRAMSITAEEIKRFAAQWDPQPFHLDEAAAKETFFGELVASGVHTFAATMRLGFDAGVLTGNSVAGLGVDKLRFLRPVTPGSELTATFTVGLLRGSRTKPAFGVVGWDAVTRNRSEEHVFSATFVTLFRRRPG